MTKAEWIELVREIRAQWPQAELPDETIAVWYRDVGEDVTSEAARQAVVAFAREGREWPPTGGMIRAKAVEFANPVSDWGQAWNLLDSAARKIGHAREDEALAWIAETSPEAAEAAKRLPFASYCLSDESEQANWRAQFRDIYRLVCEQGRKRALHPELPSKSQPRQIGTVLRELTQRREAERGEAA